MVHQLATSGIRTVCWRQLLNLTIDRQQSQAGPGTEYHFQGPPLVAHFPPVKPCVLEVLDPTPNGVSFRISIQNMGLWGIFEVQTPKLWWERFMEACLPLSPHKDTPVRWYLWRTGLHQTPNLPLPCSWISQSPELWATVNCLQITLSKTGIWF